MQALILAAGKGTRLRPLTDYIPKPMLPLCGKPLLEWVLLGLKGHGIRDFVLAVSYLAEQIENYFGSGSRWGIRIRYSRGAAPAGKAGEIWRARDLLSGSEMSSFLVAPGDTICHLDYCELLRFHAQHSAVATVAFSTLYRLEVGLAEIDCQGRVNKFWEKTSLGRPVSTGSYVLDKAIFPYIERFDPGRNEVDLPGDVFPLLLAEGVPVAGFVGDYAWWDVGRLSDYEELRRMTPEKARQILPWA